jgi:hypothetical protein
MEIKVSQDTSVNGYKITVERTVEVEVPGYEEGLMEVTNDISNLISVLQDTVIDYANKKKKEKK